MTTQEGIIALFCVVDQERSRCRLTPQIVLHSALPMGIGLHVHKGSRPATWRSARCWLRRQALLLSAPS